MLNFKKIDSCKKLLEENDIRKFSGVNRSYRQMLLHIDVKKFRHIEKLQIAINHPITVFAGMNKIGKTSVLLLVACSFENFWKYDSTKPDTELKKATWRDVISFTKKETDNGAYEYALKWRLGDKVLDGTGKRNSGAKTSWTGLGKVSKEAQRINAKIKGRDVRFIDLERILPAREFTRRLNYKASISQEIPVNEDVKECFKYILEIPDDISIYQIGSHINKRAFLIKKNIDGQVESYSSYNAASGEESLLNLLIDINDAPDESLILIDELECGIHPSLQRRLADIIQYISWTKKQQFIITTHSATLLSAFPMNSRKLIEINQVGNYNVVSRPAVNTVFSKMDCIAHPLVDLYCEDDIAKGIIRSLLIKINEEKKGFDKLVNIVMSGPKDEVRNDYERHKRNFSQLLPKKGFCCVFDGDVFNDKVYDKYKKDEEFSFFLYPYREPEYVLLSAYLEKTPNPALSYFIKHDDIHQGFSKMVELGLAADAKDAYSKCWMVFTKTADYNTLFEQFKGFIFRVIQYFNNLSD